MPVGTFGCTHVFTFSWRGEGEATPSDVAALPAGGGVNRLLATHGDAPCRCVGPLFLFLVVAGRGTNTLRIHTAMIRSAERKHSAMAECPAAPQERKQRCSLVHQVHQACTTGGGVGLGWVCVHHQSSRILKRLPRGYYGRPVLSSQAPLHWTPGYKATAGPGRPGRSEARHMRMHRHTCLHNRAHSWS